MIARAHARNLFSKAVAISATEDDGWPTAPGFVSGDPVSHTP
jgi:hypothetical protein